jgi:hypothetical protein
MIKRRLIRKRKGNKPVTIDSRYKAGEEELKVHEELRGGKE